MRHLKMVGMAVVAVFALVALEGATSASAARLCSVSVTPCPAASTYTHTTFRADLAAATNATFTTTSGFANPLLICSQSSLALTQTSAGGGEGVAVTLALTSLSFSGCSSSNPAGCSSSWTVGSLAGATGTIASTASGNGTLRLTMPFVTFSCPILGVSTLCTFGGSNTVDATLTGGSFPAFDIINQRLDLTESSTDFGCPAHMTWQPTKYTVTNESLFVATS